MKKQIILIHGGQTYDSYEEYISSLQVKVLDFERAQQKFWKDTFAERLGSDYEVIAPRMPNGHNAKYLEWKIWFDKYVPYLQDGAVLVGHSLGGIFLAKYLSENTFPCGISATILLAAPHDAEDLEDSLADFVLPDSLALFEKQGGKIHLFQSKDDPVVRYEDVVAYKAQLSSASVIVFENHGHFNIEEFPELVELIKKL